jgi:hypothetical protein
VAGTGCRLSDGGAGIECNAWSNDVRCVDPLNDDLNCDGCGETCIAGTVCHPQPGTYCVTTDCSHALPTDSCLLGDAGLGQCCEGQCKDPTAFRSDDRNCGICGLACAPGVACSVGVCDHGCMGSCPPGFSCTSNGDCLQQCDATNDNTECNLGPNDIGHCCGGACADLTHDPSSCGTCGLACSPGTVCLHAACVPASTCTAATQWLPCDLGAGHQGTCCSGACVDTTSDGKNCGACGLACLEGMTCKPSDVGYCFGGGVCTVYAATCVLPSGTAPITCADVGTAHCPPGEFCAVTSPAGTFCVPLDCTGRADGDACLAGPETLSQCCGGRCADVSQDPSNCMYCGHACASGQCVGGTCLPAPGTGGACAADADCPEGLSCAAGACVPAACAFGGFCATDAGAFGECCPVPIGGAPFPEFCFDIANDPTHCGGCSQACDAGETCVRGACSGGTDVCPGRAGNFCDIDAGFNVVCCPSDGCVDLRTNDNHCGSCDNLCEAPQHCVNGFCQ